MTPEQLLAFKNALTEACDNHLAGGGRIVSGVFILGQDRCPISCLLNDIPIDTGPQLTKVLGFEVSSQEAWTFIAGFDNTQHTTGSYEDSYRLGRELRAKYLPEK